MLRRHFTRSPLQILSLSFSQAFCPSALLSAMSLVVFLSGVNIQDPYGPLSRDDQSRLCNATTAETFQSHTGACVSLIASSSGTHPHWPFSCLERSCPSRVLSSPQPNPRGDLQGPHSDAGTLYANFAQVTSPSHSPILWTLSCVSRLMILSFVRLGPFR